MIIMALIPGRDDVRQGWVGPDVSPLKNLNTRDYREKIGVSINFLGWWWQHSWTPKLTSNRLRIQTQHYSAVCRQATVSRVLPPSSIKHSPPLQPWPWPLLGCPSLILKPETKDKNHPDKHSCSMCSMPPLHYPRILQIVSIFTYRTNRMEIRFCSGLENHIGFRRGELLPGMTWSTHNSTVFDLHCSSLIENFDFINLLISD